MRFRFAHERIERVDSPAVFRVRFELFEVRFGNLGGRVLIVGSAIIFRIFGLEGVLFLTLEFDAESVDGSFARRIGDRQRRARIGYGVDLEGVLRVASPHGKRRVIVPRVGVFVS